MLSEGQDPRETGAFTPNTGLGSQAARSGHGPLERVHGGTHTFLGRSGLLDVRTKEEVGVIGR